MGQGAFSSIPVEIAHVQKRSGKTWHGAVAEMQGWRSRHEDAHFFQDGTISYFGVLDGHGGDASAHFVARHLPDALRTSAEKKTGGKIWQGVSEAFIDTDSLLQEHLETRLSGDASGSTCVIAGIREGADGAFECFIANAGDSRGLLIRRGGGNNRNYLASTDHKPGEPAERARILKAGGFVSGIEGGDVPRLEGSLAVSRGFGDFTYKKDTTKPPPAQKVSCVPEVISMGLEVGDLLVLGCDGIFDVMTSDALVERLFKDPDLLDRDLGGLAADILKECLAAESRDNMTLMIIQLGRSEGGLDGNSFVGIEKYNAISNESVRCLYRSFLKRCAETSELPAEAQAIIDQDEPEHFGQDGAYSELQDLLNLLEPLETPAAALRRCRPPPRCKRKASDALSQEEAKFARLSEICDALVTQGLHDVYQVKREHLEDSWKHRKDKRPDMGIVSWRYRWSVGEVKGEIFGPFETETIAGWMRSCCFSNDQPAEFQRCCNGVPELDIWIRWDDPDFQDFLRDH